MKVEKEVCGAGPKLAAAAYSPAKTFTLCSYADVKVIRIAFLVCVLVTFLQIILVSKLVSLHTQTVTSLEEAYSDHVTRLNRVECEWREIRIALEMAEKTRDE